jgi:hypothetical protein
MTECSNKPLVPTRNGEAPLLAPQPQRWASNVTRAFAFACVFLVGAAMADQTDFSTPQPTPEMVREAKRNPGGWIYAISGTYGPNDAVPPEAIAGAWKVDDKGNIIPGSFKPNPNYKKE